MHSQSWFLQNFLRTFMRSLFGWGVLSQKWLGLLCQLLQLTHPCLKNDRKIIVRLFVNTNPGTAFTILYFLHNLQMVPISQIVRLHKDGKACKGETPQLIWPICKLQRKLIVVNGLPELVFAKPLAYFYTIIIWVGVSYHKSGQDFYASFCC